MGYYTVQFTIPTIDNLEENYASNTWHISADDTTALGLAITAIKSVYTSVADRMSGLVRPDDWPIKAYDDADSPPRAPVHYELWDTGLTYSSAALPTEVALCLSFQGTQVSGTPQARKRGRIYLPFLYTSAADGGGRVTSATVSDLAAAGGALLTASNGAATWSWVTRSTVAPGYSDVTNGWVDNEFDTQRRRGRTATSRTTFS
jgi:hypothetical protein